MLMVFKPKQGVNDLMKQEPSKIYGCAIPAVRVTPLAACLLASGLSIACLPLLLMFELIF
jgi:hypothetical protein